jgi:hypothetical protein
MATAQQRPRLNRNNATFVGRNMTILPCLLTTRNYINIEIAITGFAIRPLAQP